MPLSNDQVQALLAKRRKKGLYEDRLIEALESDEMGFDVKEDWPLDFAGKEASTLYQGLRNAAEKLGVSDDVEVISRDGSVYLLIKSRSNGVNTADTASEDDGDGEEVPITTSNGNGTKSSNDSE